MLEKDICDILIAILHLIVRKKFPPNTRGKKLEFSCSSLLLNNIIVFLVSQENRKRNKWFTYYEGRNLTIFDRWSDHCSM